MDGEIVTMLGWLVLPLIAPLTAAVPEAAPAEIAWVAEGEFCEPETVLALPDETLLVSNVCGYRETGNGFLTLLDRRGAAIDWRVVSGLDAPLGMALRLGQLYVVDNNRVRVFRWPGYAPLRTIALETSVANDLAVGDDESIYVSDTARGEVIVVNPQLEQSVLIDYALFPGANGMHIDGDTLYVGGQHLWRVDLHDLTVTRIGPEWLADIDGIEQETDGTLQITPVGGPLIRLSDEVEVLGGDGISSANHGFAAGLGLALIPTGFDNTVVAVRIPGPNR